MFNRYLELSFFLVTKSLNKICLFREIGVAVVMNHGDHQSRVIDLIINMKLTFTNKIFLQNSVASVLLCPLQYTEDLVRIHWMDFILCWHRTVYRIGNFPFLFIRNEKLMFIGADEKYPHFSGRDLSLVEVF